MASYIPHTRHAFGQLALADQLLDLRAKLDRFDRDPEHVDSLTDAHGTRMALRADVQREFDRVNAELVQLKAIDRPI